MKYKLKELQDNCTEIILKNQEKVAGMINWKEDSIDLPELREGSCKQPVSGINIGNFITTVFNLVDDHLSNTAMPKTPNITANDIRLLLTVLPSHKIQPVESSHNFTIECDIPIWLTHLEFSKPRDENGDIIDCDVEIHIKKQTGDCNVEKLFNGVFNAKQQADNPVEIPTRIEIVPNVTYRVHVCVLREESKLFADETIRTNQSMVAKGVKFKYVKNTKDGLLVKGLIFQPNRNQ